MADILASLAVAIGAETSGLQKGIAIAKKELRGLVNFGASLQDIGRNLSIGITAPLGLVAGAAIRASAEMDGLRRGLTQYVGEGQKLEAELTKLKEVAKLPGLGLKEAIQGSTNLQAAGFSADFARRALTAFGGALALVGKGKAELDRVTLALTQINNTPFVQGQDLNQLRQALPQIGEVIKKTFGVTTVEALKAAGVTSKQFIEGVTAEFEKLPKVTGGLKNSLENLGDAGTVALDTIGSAIDRVFNIQGVADGVSGLASSFAALPAGAQDTAVALGAAAAAVGPLSLGLGFLAQNSTLLKVGFAALLSPTSLVVAAIAAAAVGVALFVANSKTATEQADAQRASVDRLQQGLLPLINRYEELKAKTNPSKAEQEELRKVIQQIGEQVPGATTAVGKYGEALDISAGIARDFIKEQQTLLKYLNATAIKEEEAAVGKLTTAYDKAASRLRDLTTERRGQERQRAENVFRSDPQFGLSDPRAAASANAEFIKLQATVAELKGQLDGANLNLKRLKGELTATAAAAGTGSGGTAAAVTETNKTLDALAKELLKNQRLLDGFGRTFDLLTDRSHILKNGVNSLVEDGFKRGTPIVAGFEAQLKRVSDELEAMTHKPHMFDVGFGYKQELTAKPKKFDSFNAVQVIPPVDNTDYKNSLKTTEAITQAFAGSMSGAFAGLGASIGNAFAGSEDFGKAFLKILGGFATQMGTALIGIGAGLVTAVVTAGQGIAMIAGGTALTAVGAALGVAGSASSGGGGGGGGGSYSPPSVGGYSAPSARAAPALAAQTAITHNIVMTQRGSDLVGVLRLTNDRIGRVRGG